MMGKKLPKGWKWVEIKEIADVNPKRVRRTLMPDTLTPFVPMEAVDEIIGEVRKVQYKPYSKIGNGYTYFENGDIIVAKITPCMQNGKSAIIAELPDGFGFGSSEFIVLKPKDVRYTEWLFYRLRSIEFRKEAEENFTGSAGQQRVPTSFVESFKIPVPDYKRLDELKPVTDNLKSKLHQINILKVQAETQLSAIEALPGAVLREVFGFEGG